MLNRVQYRTRASCLVQIKGKKGAGQEELFWTFLSPAPGRAGSPEGGDMVNGATNSTRGAQPPQTHSSHSSAHEFFTFSRFDHKTPNR